MVQSLFVFEIGTSHFVVSKNPVSKPLAKPVSSPDVKPKLVEDSNEKKSLEDKDEEGV